MLVRGGDFLSAFTGAELDHLSYLFLRLHSKTLQVAQIFWGLWLFPFGMLVMRSGFIPRFFGLLLFVAGLGYLTDAVVSLLLPQHAEAVGQVTFVMIFGEVPIILWLLIWGARERSSHAPAG